jgi:hypothetical protein
MSAVAVTGTMPGIGISRWQASFSRAVAPARNLPRRCVMPTDPTPGKYPPAGGQGNRIWIFHTQIAGRKVDSGGIGIGQLRDAEIRFFEGNVRAN